MFFLLCDFERRSVSIAAFTFSVKKK